MTEEVVGAEMHDEAVAQESPVADLREVEVLEDGDSVEQENIVEQESAESDMVSDEDSGEDSENSAEATDTSGEEEPDLDEIFSDAQIQGLIEALVFTNGEPIGLGKLKRVTGLADNRLRDILESIQMKFEIEDSGFRLVHAAGKYQFRTDQAFGAYIKKLKEEKPRKLTPAALETLAIVAYRQPIVKSDIEKIRGVDATPTIKTLIERRLIRIVGHQATVGQPALYGTSDTFLKIFGLNSISELPSLRDLRELEEDPGETEELSAEFSEDYAEEELEEDCSEEGSKEAAEESESSNIVELPSGEGEDASDEEQPLVGNE